MYKTAVGPEGLVLGRADDSLQAWNEAGAPHTPDVTTPPTRIVCSSHGASLGWEETTDGWGILSNFLNFSETQLPHL